MTSATRFSATAGAARVSASNTASAVIFQIFPPKAPRISNKTHNEMTADYQSARSAKSGMALQTGADGAGLCRYSDARIVVFNRCGWRWIRHCDLAAPGGPELVDLRLPSWNRGPRESRVPMTPA